MILLACFLWIFFSWFGLLYVLRLVLKWIDKFRTTKDFDSIFMSMSLNIFSFLPFIFSSTHQIHPPTIPSFRYFICTVTLNIRFHFSYVLIFITQQVLTFPIQLRSTLYICMYKYKYIIFVFVQSESAWSFDNVNFVHVSRNVNVCRSSICETMTEPSIRR